MGFPRIEYIGPRLNSAQVRTLTEYLTDAHPSGEPLQIASTDDDVLLVTDERIYEVAEDGSVTEAPR